MVIAVVRHEHIVVHRPVPARPIIIHWCERIVRPGIGYRQRGQLHEPRADFQVAIEPLIRQ